MKMSFFCGAKNVLRMLFASNSLFLNPLRACTTPTGFLSPFTAYPLLQRQYYSINTEHRHPKHFHCPAALSIALPQSLTEDIECKAAQTRALITKLEKQADSIVLSKTTLRGALTGMRGCRSLICETSEVDPHDGLKYRGVAVGKLIRHMQKNQSASLVNGSSEGAPSSEALLWYLLADKIPTERQVELLRQEILSRMALPEHAKRAVEALPPKMHPMAQFIVGVTACETESAFAKAYAAAAMQKDDYWKFTLHDGLSLLAKLPLIGAFIYHRFQSPDPTHQASSFELVRPDPKLDWASNTARLLGCDNDKAHKVMRLYMFLHADHEAWFDALSGGNVSAHAGHLVGSALSDPFLAFSASMAGLAGPLHGLANQECLRLLRRMHKHFEEAHITPDGPAVKRYIQEEVLDRGQVVPGFGHAVLRHTDPRFIEQHEFFSKQGEKDALGRLLNICVEIVPPLLKAEKKISNPYPNVDAHSGVILNHCGITEEDYFTVLFGQARAIGIVSQLVWDRLLHIPIERPKSVTLGSVEEMANTAPST